MMLNWGQEQRHDRQDNGEPEERNQEKQRELFQLGNQLKKQGKWSESITNYEKVIQMNHAKNPKYLFAAALVEIQLGKLQHAEAYLDACLRLKPLSKKYFQKYEDLLIFINNRQKLLKLYDHQIDLFPQNSSLLFSKAELLHDLKKYEEAEKMYNDCLRVNPQDEMCYTAYGLMLMKMGKFEESQYIFMKCLKINPNNDICRNGLGCLYEQMGRKQQALENYRISAQLVPGDCDYTKKMEEIGSQCSSEYACENTISSNSNFQEKKQTKLHLDNNELKSRLSALELQNNLFSEELSKLKQLLQKKERTISLKNNQIEAQRQIMDLLEEENNKLRDRVLNWERQEERRKENLENKGLCKICLNEKAIYIYVDCGHLCLCSVCNEGWKGSCPLCRINSRRQCVYSSCLFVD